MNKNTVKLVAVFSILVIMITVGTVSSLVTASSKGNGANVIGQIKVDITEDIDTDKKVDSIDADSPDETSTILQTDSNADENVTVDTEPSTSTQEESSTVKTENTANDKFAYSGTAKDENEASVNNNLMISMNGNEKRKLNIFLSNFSEGFLDNYGKGDPNETYNLINFAFWHNTINNPAKVVYTDENMGISASNVNATLEKYIGITVPRQTASVTFDDWTYEWRYEDGMFWTQASESDSCFSFFNIAKEMYDNHNGTYTVIFEVFDDSNLGGTLEEYEAALSKCYSYTPEEALTAGVSQGDGTAVVRKKIYNGKETYELIEYDFK